MFLTITPLLEVTSFCLRLIMTVGHELQRLRSTSSEKAAVMTVSHKEFYLCLQDSCGPQQQMRLFLLLSSYRSLFLSSLSLSLAFLKCFEIMKSLDVRFFAISTCTAGRSRRNSNKTGCSLIRQRQAGGAGSSPVQKTCIRDWH